MIQHIANALKRAKELREAAAQASYCARLDRVDMRHYALVARYFAGHISVHDSRFNKKRETAKVMRQLLRTPRRAKPRN